MKILFEISKNKGQYGAFNWIQPLKSGIDNMLIFHCLTI